MGALVGVSLDSADGSGVGRNVGAAEGRRVGRAVGSVLGSALALALRFCARARRGSVARLVDADRERVVKAAPASFCAHRRLGRRCNGERRCRAPTSLHRALARLNMSSASAT